jgi:uncharacterized protein (DUF3084 family)
LAGLILGSGLLAYLGDILGTRFGKRRISILRMRPRHTSSLITAITGMLIALVILFSLSVTSDTVRTAIFSMKYLQRQINNLTVELQESRNESELLSLRIVETREQLKEKEEQLQEVTAKLSESIPRLEETRKALSELKKEKKDLEKTVKQLRSEAEVLRQGLQEIRVGKIAVYSNEILAQEAIPSGSDPEYIKSLLESMREKARILIAARLGLSPVKVSLNLETEKEREIISQYSYSEDRKAVRLFAASNILVGESVNVKYQILDSELIYTENELLISDVVFPPYKEEDAEAILHTLLRQVNNRSVSDGLLPDPRSGTVGSVEANDFFAAVHRLTVLQKTSTVKIFTSEKIYSEGPLRIRIVISPVTGL